VDESTQATEPEALIPMVLGAKQVAITSPSWFSECCSKQALHSLAEPNPAAVSLVLLKHHLNCLRWSWLGTTASWDPSSCARKQLKPDCVSPCLRDCDCWE
jgi:hypothetical protein